MCYNVPAAPNRPAAATVFEQACCVNDATRHTFFPFPSSLRSLPPPPTPRTLREYKLQRRRDGTGRRVEWKNIKKNKSIKKKTIYASFFSILPIFFVLFMLCVASLTFKRVLRIQSERRNVCAPSHDPSPHPRGERFFSRPGHIDIAEPPRLLLHQEYRSDTVGGGKI